MRFKRTLQPVVNVDLIPMIDIVFQLVVFFMVSTTFVITPGIGLVLPSSSTAEQVAMTNLVITVVSADEVYLNKEATDMAGLEERLRGVSTFGAEDVRSVIVEGDRSVSYALMIDVLDILRTTGFRGVNLKTKEVPPDDG